MNCSQCGRQIGKYTKTGLCIDCWRKYNRGENASNWQGGRAPYKLVTLNGRQIAEHRYIWEQAYGRLPNGWVIHHIDRDKGNNCLSNLMALPNGKHWSNDGLAERLKRNQIKRIYKELFSLEEII